MLTGISKDIKIFIKKDIKAKIRKILKFEAIHDIIFNKVL